VKLVVPEPGSDLLSSLLRDWPERVSSALARLELRRALRRASASAAEHRRADQILVRIALVQIDDAVLAIAADLEPTSLRSLDAIHLATALSLGADLGGFVTFDARLTEAAEALGVRVVLPASS
jgi:uncharacterized protein